MSKSWSNLEVLPANDPPTIVWASRGGDGSGKSYFAMTAPGPIFVCAFDERGLDRVDKTIRSQREIRIGRYGFNSVEFKGDREKIRRAATPIWERFVEEYFAALDHIKKLGHGTVIWDREDMCWGLRRYAAFGGQKNEGSRTGALDYGDLNEEFIGLLQIARQKGANLGLLQGLTDDWRQKFDQQKAKMVSYKSGEMIPDGFRKLPDYVDITLDHRWDVKAKEYTTTIRKFPVKAQKDQDYQSLDFFTMATLAFPDSDPMRWLNEEAA